MARRQFMRGTDPTKSTWVYPKLIGKKLDFLSLAIKNIRFIIYFILVCYLV